MAVSALDKNKLVELNISELLKQLEENAWYGGGKTTAYLVTKDDVITLNAYTYEPSYESFSTAHSITLNDEILFREDSHNVGAYHNEEYVIGEFKTSDEAVSFLEEYLQDKNVTLQYDKPEKEIIWQMINRNHSIADKLNDAHSTYIECRDEKTIIELKSKSGTSSHFLYVNNNCVVSYAPTEKVYNYLCDYLKGKRYAVITDEYKVATLNAERNKEMANTTENKKKRDLTFIDFSNHQIFNERTIKDKEGNDVTLVSVSLPSSAEHKGYYIDVQKRFVYSSKYNNKMSCVSYVQGQDVPIKHYDKETNTQDKIVIKAEDLKKEFNSWKTNKKNNSTKETSQEQYSQSAPDFEEIEEQDYEPIEI